MVGFHQRLNSGPKRNANSYPNSNWGVEWGERLNLIIVPSRSEDSSRISVHSGTIKVKKLIRKLSDLRGKAALLITNTIHLLIVWWGKIHSIFTADDHLRHFLFFSYSFTLNPLDLFILNLFYTFVLDPLLDI